MRALRLSLASLLLASALAAQTPHRTTARTPLATVRSAGLDVAAALDSRVRVGLEPLVFGRWSVSLTGSFTTTPDQTGYYGGPVPLAGTPLPVRDPSIPCPPNCLGYYAPSPKYRAWSFDLGARWYPAALTVNASQARLMAYVGEFVGYHSRRFDEFPIIYAQPLSPDTLNPPQPPDSVYPGPLPGPAAPYYGDGVRRTITGIEPGAEAGLRMMPLPRVFVDVGAWFKVVRLGDPMSRRRPGDVDARLVVAVGVGW